MLIILLCQMHNNIMWSQKPQNQSWRSQISKYYPGELTSRHPNLGMLQYTTIPPSPTPPLRKHAALISASQYFRFRCSTSWQLHNLWECVLDLPNGRMSGVVRLNVIAMLKTIRIQAYWTPYRKSYWPAYVYSNNIQRYMVCADSWQQYIYIHRFLTTIARSTGFPSAIL